MNVLITGTSRGIGLEFVKQLSKIDAIDRVIASSRNASEALKELASTKDSKVSLAPLDVASEASIAALPTSLTEHMGLNRLDIVIHNAGVSSSTHPIEPALRASKADMMRCFEINVAGPLLLTQALMPLLCRAEASPTPSTVLFVSSNMGSIENTVSSGQAGWTSSPSYRASKAALNMVCRCLDAELNADCGDRTAKTELIVTAIHPGWVQTDMGNAGGRTATLTVEESVGKMIETLGKLSPDQSGSFLNLDGSKLPW